jgi:hypothetical protein
MNDDILYPSNSQIIASTSYVLGPGCYVLGLTNRNYVCGKNDETSKGIKNRYQIRYQIRYQKQVSKQV